MPMSFPDMDSLKMAAVVWNFREPREDEPEEEFRTALADHVRTCPGADIIESMEIRTGKGWDQFTQEENLEMVRS